MMPPGPPAPPPPYVRPCSSLFPRDTIASFNRWQYETGNSIQGANYVPPSVVWEWDAVLFAGPCLLTRLEVACDVSTTVAHFVLLYDADTIANATARLQARHTFGPIPIGGGKFDETFTEPFTLPDGTVVEGVPFINGCVLLASSTPRTYTAPTDDAAFAIFARGLRAGGQ